MLLGAAIIVEVAATLSLRASQDHSAWLVVVVAGYTAAFALLTLVLRTGMSIGVAYGIWGALGTAVTAVLAAAIFGDPFTWPIVVGIGLIIAGVLCVELGSRHGRCGAVADVVGAGRRDLVEVFATLALRASDGFRKQVWIVPVTLGYLVSFYLLWLTLSLGMPVGIAYGVWTACGVALVAVVAAVLFGEPLTWLMGVGIALIVGGRAHDRDGRRRALSTPASSDHGQHRPRAPASSPTRRLVASAISPTTGGDDDETRPASARSPPSARCPAADPAADRRRAWPRERVWPRRTRRRRSPAMVPGTLGNASATPIPTAAMHPPARATARSPNRSTSRSPSSRPTNWRPTSAM